MKYPNKHHEVTLNSLKTHSEIIMTYTKQNPLRFSIGQRAGQRAESCFALREPPYSLSALAEPGALAGPGSLAEPGASQSLAEDNAD